MVNTKYNIKAIKGVTVLNTGLCRITEIEVRFFNLIDNLNCDFFKMINIFFILYLSLFLTIKVEMQSDWSKLVRCSKSLKKAGQESSTESAVYV